MTMFDAPSDRDYSEYLNPSEPELEEPQEERKSWVYQPCYSIDYLKLPKVEKATASEEVPF